MAYRIFTNFGENGVVPVKTTFAMYLTDPLDPDLKKFKNRSESVTKLSGSVTLFGILLLLRVATRINRKWVIF